VPVDGSLRLRRAPRRITVSFLQSRNGHFRGLQMCGPGIGTGLLGKSEGAVVADPEGSGPIGRISRYQSRSGLGRSKQPVSTRDKDTPTITILKLRPRPDSNRFNGMTLPILRRMSRIRLQGIANQNRVARFRFTFPEALPGPTSALLAWIDLQRALHAVGIGGDRKSVV